MINQKVKVAVNKKEELPKDDQKYIEHTVEVEGNITRVTIVKKVSCWYQIKESVGLHFGMSYMIMRLIGIQLIVIGNTYLNFVQANTNSSVIMGFLLYVFFGAVYSVIGYQLFEGGLAGRKLLDETEGKKEMMYIQNNETPTSTDRGGQIDILDHAPIPQGDTKDVKEEKGGSFINNKILLSHISKHMVVFFAEQKFPSNKVHLFMPFISFMRDVVKLVLVFLFRYSPYIHVLILIVIEIVYMVIHMIYNNKIDKIGKIVDIINCVSNSLYVILKIATLFPIDDSKRQGTIGIVMLVIVFINIGVNVSFVVYSLIRYTIHIIKKGIERCRLADEEKKMIDKQSKWKVTSIYEYTDPLSSNETHNQNQR